MPLPGIRAAERATVGGDEAVKCVWVSVFVWAGFSLTSSAGDRWASQHVWLSLSKLWSDVRLGLGAVAIISRYHSRQDMFSKR